ncbi:MAG: hypothetical protein ABJG68_10200 [Crocinitomicaceae bacterium]
MFLQFDALHYLEIMENGYADYRVAFFPLFPKLWSLLNASPALISGINFLFYVFGFLLLNKTLKLETKTFIISLLLPSIVFFCVPYTEALFYLSGALVLIGIHKLSLRFFLLGLFLTALSRPAYTIFIPAILICFSFFNLDSRTKIKFIGGGVAVLIFGTLAVGFIQYLDTGRWFEFFAAQKLWGNELQIPSLPLTSWSDGIIIRLDGVALLVGLTSAYFVVLHIKNYILKLENDMLLIELFSLLYLAGISFAILLFRGGSLFSLNRFVFATPFVVIFINYLVRKNYRINWKRILIVFLVVELYWLLFASYVHIQTLFKYTGATLILLCVVSLLTTWKTEKSYPKYINIFGIVVLLTFQMYIFLRYFTGSWIA